MPASTPEVVTGPVEIALALGPSDDREALALTEAVSSWVDAVTLGFFGPAWVRVREPFAVLDRQISGVVECDRLPRVGLDALSSMVTRAPGAGDSSRADRAPLAWPALPAELPFEMTYPEDLRRFVRVEMEFRRPPDAEERASLFGAFAVWDELVEAMADPEWVGQDSDHRSRRLGPCTVEHEIDGYYASFDCLQSIVWFGLRLQARLPIARMTIE